MTYKILITDDISPQGLSLLESAEDITFDVIKGLKPDTLAETIPGYDGLIVRSSVKVTRPVIEASDKLKVVGRAGAGVDNIDVGAASLKGIIVMNTPGANSVATAEHTMAMLLSLCRHVPQGYKALRAGRAERNGFVGVELYRKVIGVVGLGRIGSRVVQRCQAFGMQVLAYDPYISDEVARQLKVTLVDLDDLLSRSDFITLHVALTPETKHLINRDSLAKTKPGVRLVNCARGDLVDDDALVEALRRGHVAGAALDVYATEPLPDDSVLRDAPNLLMTPHLAASTVEAQRDVGTQIADQLLNALRGQEYRNAVNMPVVDARIFQDLRPHLQLAERLGSLQMQLADGRVKRVEIEFQGRTLEQHVKPLAVALLKGLLDPITDTSVNYINAPHLAMQRGISIAETHGLPTPGYADLISCRVAWDGGERVVAGSLLAQELPRVVQIDGFNLDAQLEGLILVMESLDVPGVVGQVATLLGEQQVNIAEWRMGRTTTTADPDTASINLSFIKLDSPVPAETLAHLENLERVRQVRQIKL